MVMGKIAKRQQSFPKEQIIVDSHDYWVFNAARKSSTGSSLGVDNTVLRKCTFRIIVLVMSTDISSIFH